MRLILTLTLLLALATPAYAVTTVPADVDGVTTSAEINTIAATPAQGARADTALQPGDIGSTGKIGGSDTAFNSTVTISSTPAGGTYPKTDYSNFTITGTSAGAPASGYLYTDNIMPHFTTVANESGHNQSTSTNDGRTGIGVYRVVGYHNGDGDFAAYNGAVTVMREKVGSTHWLANPAAVLFNGTVDSLTNGGYLNPFEIELKDNGYDVAAMGPVIRLNRTNATGAKGAVWGAYRADSTGTQPIDSAYNMTGKMKVGVDGTAADYGTNKAAMAIKSGDKIYFNASSTPDASGAKWYADTLGASWLGFNGTQMETSSPLKIPVTGSTQCLQADTNVVISGTGSACGSGGGGTPGGSDGNIQYNNGGAFGGFGTYDDTNQRTTITSSSTLAAGQPSFILEGNNNTERLAVKSHASSPAPLFVGMAGQGTIGSPSAVTAGKILGGISGAGWNGTAYGGSTVGATASSAFISLNANETHSTSAQGTYIDFQTTANGTTSRTTKMRVNNDGSVNITGINSGYPYVWLDSFAAHPLFIGQRANGTSASKTAVVADDLLFSLSARGYHDSNYSGDAATVSMLAAGTFTATSTPTYIQFNATASGSTTPSERMRVTGAGVEVTGSLTLNSVPVLGTTVELMDVSSAADSFTFPALTGRVAPVVILMIGTTDATKTATLTAPADGGLTIQVSGGSHTAAANGSVVYDNATPMPSGAQVTCYPRTSGTVQWRCIRATGQ